MSNIALVLKTAGGHTIAHYDLNTARVEQIDAINGAYYQFTDTATGTGPVRIDTARSGDDLLISLTTATEPTSSSKTTSRAAKGRWSACRVTANSTAIPSSHPRTRAG